MHTDSSKKVQQVIASSRRVTQARRMAGLKNGEYIAELSSDGAIIGNYKTKKTRTLKSINGQKVEDFIKNKVEPYIQKGIIEYYNIPVINGVACILMGRQHSSGYDFGVSFVKEDDIKRTLIIKLRRKLNAEDLRHLFRQIKEWDNCDGETECPHERTKPIDFFDKKFAIMKEYEELKRKYFPKQIPSTVLDILVQKTKKLLKIKTIYTADDFRKTISEFKNAIKT